MQMLQKLAWFQLLHDHRRLLAALAGIAFAVLLQLTQLGFRDALFASATSIYSHLNADLVLASSQYQYIVGSGTITRRRLYEALGLPQVESVAALDLRLVPYKNPAGQDRRILVIAFDPSRAVLDLPGVAENMKHLKVPDVVLFDAHSHPDMGPIADLIREQKALTTQIGGRRMTIAGVFDLGPSFASPGHAIMSDITFRRLFNRSEGIAELGLIRLKPGTDVSTAAADLSRRLPPDVKVFTRQEFVDVEQAYWNKVAPIGFIFLSNLSIGLIVGAVIVYQILYTDVSDHLGEYATLKAMGYSDIHLYLVVLEEALILSVAGYPIGFAFSELVYSAARSATLLPVYMTVPRAVLVFALTLGMSAVSGIIAMRKLRSADPAEVF